MIKIDGIIVSECEHFDESNYKAEENSYCLAFCSPYPEGTCYDNCNDHPNCAYKNWQRAISVMKEIEIMTGEIAEQQKCNNCIDDNDCYNCLKNKIELIHKKISSILISEVNNAR